jgi:hypothetical protein
MHCISVRLIKTNYKNKKANLVLSKLAFMIYF